MKLPPREEEIVRRALRGESNKAIALDLNVAFSTVRVLICRAAKRYGVRGREALLATAANDPFFTTADRAS